MNPAASLRRAALALAALPLALLAVDLLLRRLASNNADPTRWTLLDLGIYTLGATWGLFSWGLTAVALARALASRPLARRLVVGAIALVSGALILLSFGYRLYYYQSPSWQVIRFTLSEPDNAYRLLSWNIYPIHALGLALFAALIWVSLSVAIRHITALAPARISWRLAAPVALFYAVNSSLTLLAQGFQDPLPVEANNAAAVAQFLLASTTKTRHLVAPVRPPIQPQPKRPRPSVLLLLHESLRGDGVFADLGYDRRLDARQLSPFSHRLAERQGDGFFVMPRARSNSTATESSLPTILSGLDLGGAPDAYGNVQTLWSLGKAAGAKTWIFSAQSYAWSHFDEYFFDRNVDLARTGRELAPEYVNDVGVDDAIPVDRALEHIARLHQAGEHWVGVIHFNATHVPGYPGPGVAPAATEHQRCLQATTYIDSLVQRTLEGLEKIGADRNTILLSTSDHGEPYDSPRRIRRLGSYYEETIRIPFWIRVPPALSAEHPEWAAALARWQTRNVQNIDLLPTARDALLLDDPGLDASLPGRSLLRPPGDLPDLVSGQSTCAFRAWWQEGLFIVNGQHKLILSNERPTPELYDLASDPSEQQNLWGDPAAREAALRWARPHILAGPERTAACKRVGASCILD